MAHVIVEVNGRPYTMQCPDGEEEHLKELARLLDAEVVRIRHSVGTVGDIRLWSWPDSWWRTGCQIDPAH